MVASFQFEGIRLDYEVLGEGRPLLLFHANGFSAGSYRPMHAELTARGWRIYALNFMGHGGSETSADFHNWDYFGRQVRAFAEHLDLPAYFAAGHSIGGASLLLAAARLSGLRAAALLDPTVMTPFLARLARFLPNPLAGLAEKRRREFKDLRVVERSYRMSPVFRDWHTDSMKGYLESALEPHNGGYRLRLDPKIEAQIFRSFHSGWSVFRRIQIPLLVMTARQSEVTPDRAAKLLLRSHAKSSWVRHTGSHCFPMEDPSGVAREVSEFFLRVAE